MGTSSMGLHLDTPGLGLRPARVGMNLVSMTFLKRDPWLRIREWLVSAILASCIAHYIRGSASNGHLSFRRLEGGTNCPCLHSTNTTFLPGQALPGPELTTRTKSHWITSGSTTVVWHVSRSRQTNKASRWHSGSAPEMWRLGRGNMIADNLRRYNKIAHLGSGNVFEDNRQRYNKTSPLTPRHRVIDAHCLLAFPGQLSSPFPTR